MHSISAKYVLSFISPITVYFELFQKMRLLLSNCQAVDFAHYEMIMFWSDTGMFVPCIFYVKPVNVVTDSWALIHIKEGNIVSSTIVRWALTIEECNSLFEINVVTDRFTRALQGQENEDSQKCQTCCINFWQYIPQRN